MTSLHQLKRHRAINIFLSTYKEIWLSEENVGQEKLVEDLTESFEEHEQNKGSVTEQEEESSPDPLIQLITTFCRSATTEHGSTIKEDPLYERFAYIFSESCGGAEEDDGCGDGGGGEADTSGEQQQQQLQEAPAEKDEGQSIHVRLNVQVSKSI